MSQRLGRIAAPSDRACRGAGSTCRIDIADFVANVDGMLRLYTRPSQQASQPPMLTGDARSTFGVVQ